MDASWQIDPEVEICRTDWELEPLLQVPPSLPPSLPPSKMKRKKKSDPTEEIGGGRSVPPIRRSIHAKCQSDLSEGERGNKSGRVD